MGALDASPSIVSAMTPRANEGFATPHRWTNANRHL
jgi:hypothetical protein